MIYILLTMVVLAFPLGYACGRKAENKRWEKWTSGFLTNAGVPPGAQNQKNLHELVEGGMRYWEITRESPAQTNGF